MRFENYILNEAYDSASFNRYFGDENVETTVKKNAPIYDADGNKTGDFIPKGEGIVVPAISKFENGKIDVVYKNRMVKISYSNVDKKAKVGGETLKINANILTKTESSKPVTVDGDDFNAKIFISARDLAETIKKSIINLKSFPDDLKNIMIDNLDSYVFSTFDWKEYPNLQHKKEIAKYYGEILLGLCVLNGESNAVKGFPVKTSSIKDFILPTSSSFVGIDSVFKTKEGSFIKVSNKSDVGAAASFHSNIIPKLMSYVENGGKIRNNLLKYMVDINLRNNLKNMEFLYLVGINYLMGNKLRGQKGEYIKRNPYEVYKNLAKNNITEYEKYLMDVVRNNKWPVTKNQNKINENLPQSFTYFICQNIAEMLNNDRKTIKFLKQFLTYWQANLNLNMFVKTGKVRYNMIQTNKGDLKITPGKGSMQSVKSLQGRLTYIIK